MEEPERKLMLLYALRCERLGAHEVAARLYESCGDLRRARRVYEFLAARLEDAGVLIAAVEAHEHAGQLEHARKSGIKLAQEMKKRGLIALAAEAFRKAGCNAEANSCFLLAMKQAARKRNWQLAAYCAETCGHFSDARRYWTRRACELAGSGDLILASHIFGRLGYKREQLHSLRKQVHLALRSKQYGLAAAAFNSLGNEGKARSMWKLAAQKAAANGRFLEAANYFFRGGLDDQAELQWHRAMNALSKVPKRSAP